MTITTATEDDRLVRMAKQMNKWADQVLSPSYQKYCSTQTWTPSVNLYEASDHYCVMVELAGLTAEKIDLRIEQGRLTISGSRPVPPMPDGKRPQCVHLMEIDHGRFCRVVELPPDIAADGVAASYRSGYLSVRIPKRR